MYIGIIGVIIGALWGAIKAHKNNGTIPDKIQYALAHAIFLGLVGLGISLILGWVLFSH